MPLQSVTTQLYGEIGACFLGATGVEWRPTLGGLIGKPEEARMRTADEALSREIERGMTRQDILRRAAAVGIVGGGSFGPLAEAAFASSQIKRGGTFRQATSGGTTDFIDGQHIVAKSDIVRLVATCDALARFDEKGKIQLHLAEDLQAEKANQYLIRVRKGVEFHNGKTLTIDD